MKRCLELWLVVFFVVPILGTAPAVHAQTQAQTKTMIVTATVPARTAVIVGPTGQIERVINNSENLAEVVIVRDSQSGQSLSDDYSVMSQFEQLKPSLNFNRYGEIYHRPAIVTTLSKPVMTLTISSL